MKKIIIFILTICCLTSCKTSNNIIVKKQTSSKKITREPKAEISIDESVKVDKLAMDTEIANSIKNESSKVYNIVDYAKQFSGVKYKFGGATKNGMDCSGLVFESFRAFNVILPSSSRDMAKQGDKISITNTQEGDLLFFKTRNKRNEINHVGLVVTNNKGEIEFIHATLSTGVTVSKLSENYWNATFVEARRIL